MLDFGKLISQFDALSGDVVADNTEELIEKAADVLAAAAKQPDVLLEKLSVSDGQTFWPLAAPIEPIDTVWQLTPLDAPHTVVAVDGSQIMPSHHEVHNCYLINLGKVAISYGVQLPVVLTSNPHLYHSVDDLYPAIDRRRMYVDEAFVTLERNLLELSTLRDLALESRERALPVVAFIDGSLIQWSLDQMPDAYQRSFLQRLNDIYDSFQKNTIPLIGYISSSRSMDLVNILRVWQCPYAVSDCRQYCGELYEEDYPCSTVWPVTDRQLFSRVLPRNCRGPLMQSGGNKAVALRAPHHVVSTYLNVGTEVARIEMPRWLANQRDLANETLRAVLAQVQKGAGYPVCLSEAHNQAVIRGSDRSRFFELVANHLVQLGMPRVRVSPKESNKRRGIV